MIGNYFSHLMFFCIIVVKVGGIANDKLYVENKNGENILSKENISLLLNQVEESTKITRDPYFPQYNWKMHNMNKKLIKKHWVKRKSGNLKRKKREFNQKFHLNGDTKNVDSNLWIHSFEQFKESDTSTLKKILRTENSTQPEVTYINEWKYSYRVTFFNPGNYNISNYVCSGILMASQWVLTSLHCKLAGEMILIIGVYYIPKIIRDHNMYTIKQTIYSHKENLILVELDRPVQWDFDRPNVRAIERDEMEILLLNGKCNVLSWIPVDIERKKNTFELREYPKLKSCRMADNSRSLKDLVEVEASQSYSMCKQDMGSPVLCDGMVTGILLNVGKNCKSNLTMKLLCPALQWTSFFTERNAYYELSVKKRSPTNFSEQLVIPAYHIKIFVFISVFSHIKLI